MSRTPHMATNFGNALRVQRPRLHQHANITALVDVMLVLVLYLAFVYATQSGIVGETAPWRLPAATHGHMDTSGLHLVLTMDEVRLENSRIMALDNGMMGKDKTRDLARLCSAVAKGQALRLLGPTGEESLINRATSSGWLYLDAAHNIPYTTVEAVTRAARAGGVEHFRLIVHAKR